LKQSEVRRVYFTFDYNRDASRRTDFLAQARDNCDFKVEDLSLPKAVHDSRWQREALARIRAADVVIVLLGPDIHSARGVLDKISLQCRRIPMRKGRQTLAGQYRMPILAKV